MNINYDHAAGAPSVLTPDYAEPYTLPRGQSSRFHHSSGDPSHWPPTDSRGWRSYNQPPSPAHQEMTYRGPKPHIPHFTDDDPRQFARLKIALDNILPADATERFKYQILVDHLKLEDALLIADSYSNSMYPYSNTMASLTELYGQPHKLALQRINEVLAEPAVKSGDGRGFQLFALKVRALVGMLDQLGKEGRTELECGSHISRLLSKLPHDLRAQFKRFINPIRTPIPTLLDFSDWLEYEVHIQDDDVQIYSSFKDLRLDRQRGVKVKPKSAAHSTTVLLGCDPPAKEPESSTQPRPQINNPEKPKKYCPFCDDIQHYFNQCSEFKKFTKEQKAAWIKTNKRCWRCGREHQAAQCYLKAKCQQCNQVHLEVLHDVNASVPIRPERPAPGPIQPVTYYLDPSWRTSCVLLKMVKVLLYNGKRRIETYAILDDGSERTILLHSAAHELGLQGPSEDLALRTIRQDISTVPGRSVSFSVSSAFHPQKRFRIHGAFTAIDLGLSKHSHPVDTLQKVYRHLRGLPLHSFNQAQPLLLIGSDYPHLLSPVEPVHLGPPGGPAALKTLLGWTLQGPAKVLKHQASTPQCLLTNTLTPSAELLSHVTRLWQMDVLPYQNEKLIIRSKQDTAAVRMLEEKTIRVEVDGIQRYATPLLWKENAPPLSAPKESVLGLLRGTEKRLSKNPAKAETYNQGIKKLLDAGYIKKLTSAESQASVSAWYIPHHMVRHNGKDRIVFNCSFTHQGASLNEHLPGPTLGSTLLGVLLRFREYPIAVSSDIKGMFHQVRLLPEDKPFLRFLWRDTARSTLPDVYEWQVLPFGTTCSPCCATFALQKHVLDHSSPGEGTRHSVENCFYVDNLLQSFTSVSEAEQIVKQLQQLLLTGGFELRQWATNVPAIISHLPPELKSDSSELWLSPDGTDPPERALGLLWHCTSDTITYQLRHTEHPEPTMRNIYRVLARQYDPLGLLIPYTTRAKILVQRLWSKKRDWDDPQLPTDLLQQWHAWESELHQLPAISLPRCYMSPETDFSTCTQSIHIFSDASEKAYGAVAYLRTVDHAGLIQVAFLATRS
ncbi:hypothetical protein D5F01_LYC11197 [Larimichthys crocea]|uniref:ribonuclease H n=1 Tax=Larimichthys crocea TaxID=215358 RepID=A0A6G0IDC5_LARCR|nr:hypothetical protein D5F01_LYC11197 [Larimichthys crocea]